MGMTTNRFRCQIEGQHCSQCGSTDYENLYGPDADQGYTGCCNEPITDRHDCRGDHDDTGRIFCDDCGFEQPSERRPDLTEAHIRGCSKRSAR